MSFLWKQIFSKIGVIGLFICLGGQSGWGQVSTWTGATSGTWLTAGNWSPSGAPSGASSEAFFNSNVNAGTNGINMNGISAGNSSIGAIHWSSVATTARTVNNSSGTVDGNLTLNGITINSVANTILRNNSTGIHTIANGTRTLGIVLGNLTNNVVNVDGTGNIVISSIISGSSRKLSLNANSSGDLRLSGANTFNGGIDVNGGTLGGRLRIDAVNSLPTTGTIAVATGGRITLNVAATYGGASQSLTFNPNQTANPSLDILSDAVVTWQGTVALNADTRIEPSGASGSLTFSGNVSGSGTLIKQAAGTLVLSGTGNTMTGGTQIGNGAITVSSGSLLGTGGINMAQTSTNATTINLNNTAQTISSLSSSWTAITGTIVQTINLASGHTLTVNQSTNTTYGAGAVNTLRSILAGAGNFAKSGTGSLTFTSANTYSGATSINGGSIIVGVANALPTTSNLTLNGGNLTTGATAGFSQQMGTLNLNATSTISLGTGSHTLAFSASNLVPWAGPSLVISGWTGTGGVTGTAGKITFANSTGLTAAQLAKISFTGYSGTAVLLSSGEIVPPVQTPAIVLSSPSQVSAANVAQGATSWPLSNFQAAVTVANATLNSVAVATGGTYSTSTHATNYKLWYNGTSNTFGSATQISGPLSSVASGGTVTFSSLTQAINSGSTGYFWVTADIDAAATIGQTVNIAASPTLTFASGTPTGSISVGGDQTFAAANPVITVANGTIAAANVTQNTTNNVLYRTDVTVGTTSATLNAASFVTAGTYSASDLTNLKLWYQTSSTFNAGTATLLSTKSTSLAAGTQSFSSFTQSFPIGTGYLFLTADLPCGATSGNTVNVNAITNSSLTFATGSPTGSYTAGGAQTIIDATPVNATSLAAANGNTQSSVSWTNPTGCYSEIMIVASPAANNNGTPTGNGSAYTANLAYGSGTAFGNGYVVYKGASSPQVVSNLTNNSTYFFKIFTRNGTTWTSGTETSVQLLPVISLTNGTIGTGNLIQNTINTILYRVDVAVTNFAATLNSISLVTAGTYLAADLTNLQLWYQTSSTFNAGTATLLQTKSSGLGAGTQTFSTLTQSFPVGTGYLFLTADLPCTAVTGRTINVNAITNSSLTFAFGSPTGTYSAGGAQTIADATPVNATSPAATSGDRQSSVSWTAPTGCASEVMIVASPAANTGGTPTGNGSLYTGNLTYGSGTAFGNGWVVYEGSTTPQVVIGLTNTNTYFFKIFTRNGSAWSAGVETSVTLPTPTISLANGVISVGNITQNGTNNILYRTDVTVATASTSLNGVSFTTAGTYSLSDLTNLKLWYQTSSTFNAGTATLLSTKTTGLAAGTQTFSSLTQLFPTGTGYLFLTTDVPCATIGNTISVNAITNTSLTFSQGSPTGSGFTAGGAQTFTAVTPNNVTSLAATNGNTQSSVSWTNPTGCYSEIMIVAALATNTGTPTGDGTAYTGSLTYGSGTAIGNGWVVYKGSTSPQVVIGLTNGTQYFFKVFTRNGTAWSGGTEVSATPAAASTSTDYFRSRVASGAWGTASNWESSANNLTWATATLAPTSASAGILIQSGHTISVSTGTVSMDMATISGTLSHSGGTINLVNGSGDDLIILNGGKLQAAAAVITFASGSNIRVLNGGMIENTDNSGSAPIPTNYANDVGTQGDQVTWETGSIYNYNASQTPAFQVTYFANVNPTTIPIFRMSNNSGTIGGGSAGTINGIFEVNVATIFGGDGNKIFRNGIIGTGNITYPVSTDIGQIQITGATATLGGTGNISLGTGGMASSSSTYLTLVSDKTINTSTRTFTMNGTFDCSTNVLRGSANFTLSSSATLITANSNGVTGSSASTGSIQMTSSNETFNSGASYIYNGTAAQSTGFAGSGGSQIGAAKNIIIANTIAAVTLDRDIQTGNSLTGVLSVPGSAIFAMPNGFNISKGTGGSVSIQGTLRSGDVNGFANSNNANLQAFNASDITLGSNSIIEYYSGSQSISNTSANSPSYQNLLISSGTKTPIGNYSVLGNHSITGGTLLAGANTINVGGDWVNADQSFLSEATSTINWNGAGSQTLRCLTGTENFYMLAISGTGTLTSNAIVTVGTSNNGGLTISSGTFDASSFSVSNSGTSPLNMSGGLFRMGANIAAMPEFGTSTSAYSITGGTIELYGTASKGLQSGQTYNNLLMSAGTTTVTSTAITSVNGTLSITGSTIFDQQDRQVGSAASSLYMDGTALYRLAGSSLTKPDISGTYNLNDNSTVEFYGGTNSTPQNVRGGVIYRNVSITGINVAHGAANFTVNGTNFIIAPNAKYSMTDQKIRGTANFTVSDNATFYFGCSNGPIDGNGLTTTPGVGPVQVTGTKTFPTTAFYGFQGGASCTPGLQTGDLFPLTVAGLYMNKTNVPVTLTNDLVINGLLSVDGGTFDQSSKNVYLNGLFSASGTGQGWITNSASGLYITNVSSSVLNLPSFVSTLSGLLQIDRPVGIQLGGPLVVAGTTMMTAGGINLNTRQLTLNGSTYADLSTIVGTGGVISNGYFRTTNPNGFSGTGATIPNSSVTIQSGSIVEFAGSGTLTMFGSNISPTANNFHSVIASGGGTKYFPSGFNIGSLGYLNIVAGTDGDAMSNSYSFPSNSTVTIGGTFSTANAYGLSGNANASFANITSPVITLLPGSTINYNGATQSITSNLVYQNIVFNGSGSKILPNAPAVVNIQGDITNNVTSGVMGFGTSMVSLTGSNLQNINGAGTNTFYNLNINKSTNPVSISGISSMNQIIGILNIQAGPATTLYTNGKLALISLAFGTVAAQVSGSLIDWSTASPTNGSVNGDVIVQRATLGNDPQNRAFYVSSPVSGNLNQLKSTSTNFFWYNETKTSGVVASGARSQLWESISNPSSTTNVAGRGYSVRLKGLPNYSYGTVFAPTGPVFNGQIDYPTTFSTTLSTTTLQGWNLIGNPYPSAIDLNKIPYISGFSNVGNTFYIWQGDKFGTWTPTSNSSGNGTNGASNIVGAMQGFFVQASAAGNVRFNNTIRTTGQTDNLSFYRSSTDPNPMLGLTMSSGNYSDEVKIIFNPSVSANGDFDPKYDAYKLAPLAQVPYFYAEKNGLATALNNLPEITTNTIVPLAIMATSTANYKISSIGASSFDPSIDIYLQDKSNGVLQDLKLNPDYQVNLATGTYSNRFFIVMRAAVVNGLQGLDAEKVKIYSYEGKVYVHSFYPTAVQASITLQEVSGKTLTENNSIQIYPGINQIEGTTLADGVYLVSFSTEKLKQVAKLILIK